MYQNIVNSKFAIINQTAPPYHTRHTVKAAPWSFLDLADPAGTPEEDTTLFADLSTPPPYHPPPDGFQVNFNLYLILSKYFKIER